MQNAFPRQVLRDHQGRGLIHEYVSPCTKMNMTFAAKGMSRRLGTTTERSWAISHVHVSYIDQQLEKAFHSTNDPDSQHEIVVAAFANLLAYLGWLQGGEIFDGNQDDLVLTLPTDGPSPRLPPGVLSAVEYTLLHETKSDPTIVVDVVLAFSTMSGLIPGKWALRLRSIQSAIAGKLFPLAMHQSGPAITFVISSQSLCSSKCILKASLHRAFSNRPGHRLKDKIYSMHSRRQAGRLVVSRLPCHDEPNPPGRRKALNDRVYEHGHWAQSVSSGEYAPKIQPVGIG